MIRIRPAAERGRTDWGWLDSRHTFSFGEYHDPAHMGFRTLRVINDDRVSPGAGFGRHGHRDMEILSYVLEGALEHQDSSGGGGVIRPGEVQFMRAGTGVTHSEYNHSKTEPVHFLQIWVVPDEAGLRPTYGQRSFDREAARRGFLLLASREARDGSLQVHQDMDLWVSMLDAGGSRQLPLRASRHAWVHVARGGVSLNGTPLQEGDGAAASAEDGLTFVGGPQGAEVLLFDLG
jgi:quercetin 2,3-dioxygenase